MSEQDSSHLKEDISRLNGIIDALLFQNRSLLAENAGLKIRDGFTRPPSSYHKDALAESDAPFSYQQNGEGRSNIHPSNDEDIIGRSDAHPHNSNDLLGRSDAHPSNEEDQTGRSEACHSNGENLLGRSDARSCKGENLLGRSDAHPRNGKLAIERTESHPAIPDSIKSSLTLVGSFTRVLRASGMKKVKRSGLRNMTLILVHLHNNKTGGHRELRKVTGLSEGGLNKLIMSMKKRGLIVRESYGRFALAPADWEKIKRTFGNPSLPSR